MADNTEIRFSEEEFFQYTESFPNARFELHNGAVVAMTGPAMNHQIIAGEIFYQLKSALGGKPCLPLYAPLDVVLTVSNSSLGNSRNVFQPDVFILCDRNKYSNGKIYGAPDFVVEVASPATRANDRFYKAMVYMLAGVREYWIVDEQKEKVTVFYGEDQDDVTVPLFESPIPIKTFPGIVIDLTRVKDQLPEG